MAIVNPITIQALAQAANSAMGAASVLNDAIVSRLISTVTWIDWAFSSYLLTSNIISAGLLLGLGDMSVQLTQQLLNTKKKKWSYDFTRTGRTIAVGFVLGAFNHFWYAILDFLLEGRTLSTVLQKIALDQAIAGPFFSSAFLVGTGILEGKTAAGIYDEWSEKFIDIYKVDWMFWPFAQFINFYLVPYRFRVFYVNFATFLWNTFLCYMKFKTSPPSSKLKSPRFSARTPPLRSPRSSISKMASESKPRPKSKPSRKAKLMSKLKARFTPRRRLAHDTKPAETENAGRVLTAFEKVRLNLRERGGVRSITPHSNQNISHNTTSTRVCKKSSPTTRPKRLKKNPFPSQNNETTREWTNVSQINTTKGARLCSNHSPIVRTRRSRTNKRKPMPSHELKIEIVEQRRFLRGFAFEISEKLHLQNTMIAHIDRDISEVKAMCQAFFNAIDDTKIGAVNIAHQMAALVVEERAEGVNEVKEALAEMMRRLEAMIQLAEIKKEKKFVCIKY